MTQCTADAMHFKSLGRRNVVADFQGGTLTSDGGALLLDKTDQAIGRPARRFKDFTYCTLDSWSRPRRVVAKAEHLDKGANPRFVVASLAASAHPARGLYEQTYCGREGVGPSGNGVAGQRVSAAGVVPAGAGSIDGSSGADVPILTWRGVASDALLTWPTTRPAGVGPMGVRGWFALKAPRQPTTAAEPA